MRRRREKEREREKEKRGAKTRRMKISIMTSLASYLLMRRRDLRE